MSLVGAKIGNSAIELNSIINLNGPNVNTRVRAIAINNFAKDRQGNSLDKQPRCPSRLFLILNNCDWLFLDRHVKISPGLVKVWVYLINPNPWLVRIIIGTNRRIAYLVK